MDRSRAHLTLLGLGLASLAATAHAEEASPSETGTADMRTDQTSPAASSERPSASESDVHVVGHERVAALLNPMGAEHRLDVSVRGEVGDQEDMFFDGAHWQLGATSFVSPVYAIGGGFLELAPFSFLVLKGEVMGMSVWPIGMDGAGHYAVSGYDADVHSANLPADAAGGASGFTAGGNGTLQGAIELDARVRLVAADEVGRYYGRLGTAPHYTSMRYDLVLAREDLVLTNDALLAVEIRAASDLLVRAGVYSDLRHVPASGYVGHQVGPIVMLEWSGVAPAIEHLSVWVRGGGYTHHAIREGEATILGGVAVDYDFGGL
jgi:hypothetical protein